ncbi:MAG: LuxR C-terminal-related transcriptional regulator [Bacteroidales bacterium]|jgi:tetratricopeptide (TPR) repeat protein|nr:LuxR C-terminal-related transcriptional regulator [Bacteroidales bacterium]
MRKATFFSFVMLHLFFSATASPSLREFDSIAQFVRKNHFSYRTKSMQSVGLLYDIAQKNPGKPFLQIMATYWETRTRYSQGENDTALMARLKIEIQNCNESQYPFEYALLLYSQALANITDGNYAEAFRNTTVALEKFEKLNNEEFTVKALISLGNIFPYIRNYNMAEHYYNLAFEKVSPEQVEYYQIYINQCRLLFLRGLPDQSIDSLLKFIPVVEDFNDQGLLAVAYLNLGGCYSSTNDMERAYQCYKIVSDIIEKIDNNKLVIAVHQNLGVYYSVQKDYQKAYQHYLKAKEYASDDDNLEQLSYSLHSLSQVFEQLGYYDSAYYYLVQYEDLMSDLINNPNTIEVFQSYITMYMEASQNRLTIAEQEILLKSRQIALVIFFAVFIIIIIIFLLIISNQKRKNMHQSALLKEIENKDLFDKLQHEQEIQKLQTEKLESQVREITSYSLLLSNKNHLLQQISDLAKDTDNASKIDDIVKSNLNTDREWHDFMLHFDKVHPRFFETLRKINPNLTKNDLKLAAYIRIGMSTKQIAQILNLVPDSVKINRHRLKKKINLPADENVEDFLRNL